jgi:hypothetical protein
MFLIPIHDKHSDIDKNIIYSILGMIACTSNPSTLEHKECLDRLRREDGKCEVSLGL